MQQWLRPVCVFSYIRMRHEVHVGIVKLWPDSRASLSVTQFPCVGCRLSRSTCPQAHLPLGSPAPLDLPRPLLHEHLSGVKGWYHGFLLKCGIHVQKGWHTNLLTPKTPFLWVHGRPPDDQRIIKKKYENSEEKPSVVILLVSASHRAGNTMFMNS